MAHTIALRNCVPLPNAFPFREFLLRLVSLSIASSRRAWSAGSRAPKTDAFGSLASPHVARISLFPAFRKHSGQMKKVFPELSSEELRGLEVRLKTVGCRADRGEKPAGLTLGAAARHNVGMAPAVAHCMTGRILNDERPTRAVEELHQVAATRTERRLLGQVDCFRLADDLWGLLTIPLFDQRKE